LAGTLFFAASLTPSLLPRPLMVQGLVSGFSLAAGYAVGVFARWVWSYLGLPAPAGRTRSALISLAGAACAATAVAFLWQASNWQNSIHLLMGLEPVEGGRPLSVGLIALAVFGVLLAVGKAFRHTFLFVSHRFTQFAPRRLSYIVGVLAAAALFWSVIEGVLFRLTLQAADASFQQFDALMEADVAAPSNPLKVGSPASLVAWRDLGRAGRQFVSSGPSAAELGTFLGEPAIEPIRVYVGLNSAETIEERASLALAELLRTGAFERSLLIIVTPTGTGWVDPGALDTVEYLHRGDVASVAVQYSYLASALSLMVEPHYGAESAAALFSAVYGHWSRLPQDRRPQLYLHGLSLGALNSDLSFDIFDVVGDTFHGALWSGPPFRSETWRSVTTRREPGSPAWLPRFRDGTVIRFMNQQGGLEMPGASWGPLRIVYLQYASDPVTFFEPAALYREPAWLAVPRGPDVSPDLRWFPIVTMLQLAADMFAGDTAPRGYGHQYAPEHYIDAWISVTEPPDWSDADVARLKARFAR
jgi:uncharacterized membrane protein